MAIQPRLLTNVLKKGVIGLLLGGALIVTARLLHFPLVFQAMFFAYAMLGAAVFILLDAPPMKPVSGFKAVVALVAFYIVLSVVFIGGASLWPQYDPAVEKGKIEKLLKPRRERALRASHQVDHLLTQADSLEEQLHSVSIRVARLAPVPQQPAAGAGPRKPAAAMTLVEQGREVYDLYECYNCHKIGGKGSAKKRGPVLDNIGNLLTISDIKKKIFDPNYLYAEGFEKEHKKGRMPDKYKDLMYEDELSALAAYLSTLRNAAVETPRPVFVKSTVEHGFTVYGYVRDGAGKPLPAFTVEAKPLKKHRHPASGQTNEEGYYELFLHLHNEDAGTRLIISAGGVQKEIVADYDPSDKVTRRQASVDLFVGSS